MRMYKFVVTSFGIMLAIVVASPNCWAQIKFDNGDGDFTFLNANNWDPDTVPGPTGNFAINDNFVVTYATNDITTVNSLRIGTDAPATPGDFGTPGTLNMSAGQLIVAGGGDAFDLGRACCSGTGTMNMTGDAVLQISGTDPQIGERDTGVLNINDNASVIETTPGSTFWAIGGNGASIDVGPLLPNGLEGDGTLNVADNGSFSAKVVFIGKNDGKGVMRVSDNGSVTLSDNLVMGNNSALPNRSALVHMIGSTATLSAVNLEAANGLAEVHNQFVFDADAIGGVSPITLSNAVNITNNDLVVNLNGFPLAIGETLLLFDAAPDQIFGKFASSVVNGSVVPHTVIYDQVNGDILVQRIPEPSTAVMIGLGVIVAFCAKRRTSL